MRYRLLPGIWQEPERESRHTASERTQNVRFSGWPSRPYATEDDLRQTPAPTARCGVRDLLMAARTAADDWRYVHVGELMWGCFMMVCHLNPQEFLRLWHDAAGKPNSVQSEMYMLQRLNDGFRPGTGSRGGGEAVGGS